MLPHESKLTRGLSIKYNSKGRFNGSNLQVMTKHFKCDAQMIFPWKKILYDWVVRTRSWDPLQHSPIVRPNLNATGVFFPTSLFHSLSPPTPPNSSRWSCHSRHRLTARRRPCGTSSLMYHHGLPIHLLRHAWSQPWRRTARYLGAGTTAIHPASWWRYVVGHGNKLQPIHHAIDPLYCRGHGCEDQCVMYRSSDKFCNSLCGIFLYHFFQPSWIGEALSVFINKNVNCYGPKQNHVYWHKGIDRPQILCWLGATLSLPFTCWNIKMTISFCSVTICLLCYLTIGQHALSNLMNLSLTSLECSCQIVDNIPGKLQRK